MDDPYVVRNTKTYYRSTPPQFGKEYTMRSILQMLDQVQDNLDNGFMGSAPPTKRGYQYKVTPKGLVVLHPHHPKSKRTQGRVFKVFLNDGSYKTAYDYTSDGKLNTQGPYTQIAWEAFGEPKPRVSDVVEVGCVYQVQTHDGFSYIGKAVSLGRNDIRLRQTDRRLRGVDSYVDIPHTDIANITSYSEGDTLCF